MNYVYYCPECKNTSLINVDYLRNEKCPKCQTKLIPTHITDSDWYTKSDEEKEASLKETVPLENTKATSQNSESTNSTNTPGAKVSSRKIVQMEKFKSDSKGFFAAVGTGLVILGIIVGLIIAATFGKGHDERDWIRTIVLFIAVSGYFCFWGFIMYAISEVFKALEKICNNIANLPDALNKQ